MPYASRSPARGMNDPRPNGAAAAGSPRAARPARLDAARAPGRPRPLARIRQLWLTLSAAASAALLAPWLLFARVSGSRLLLLALGAVLLLGAAWLAFERWIAPELRALTRARDELDARHAAALRAAGETSEYLRDVSQEIRATMHAVLGQTQLLSRSPLDATQHRHMRTIDGAARVLLRIMNDLMALSRSGRRGFDVVPMGGSLHDVLRVSADLLGTAAKNRGLELELRVAFDLPDRVLLDAGRVEQLLLGACRYAIESRAQGMLRIDARAVDVTEGRFTLLLLVDAHSDAAPSGDAASGDALPHAGAAPPRPHGRIPGQALLLELVGALGGSIAWGETPGSLELRLPLQRIDGSSAPRLRPPPEAAPLIRLPASRTPLLVVDSDERSRLATLELLENLGFEVEVATSAPHAIERVAASPFALILMDTELAGLDGYLAAARILTQLGQARPPIIGLCQGPLAEARERAAAAGMDALLAKPVERAALCAALAEWLPDENNPASSGTRLSQAGALAQATQRALVSKSSAPPSSALSRELAAAAVERFVREAPGHYGALVAALGRGARDDAASIAAALAERSASCGAIELSALCRIVEAGRELPGERLDAAVQALGRALESTLGQLAGRVEPPESPPASVTHDRTPDGP